MYFEWDKELETGIKVLDDQHRGLIDAINSFFECCAAQGGSGELGVLFQSLEEYSRKHFDYEEKLMRYCGYPKLAEQASEHALFLADLDAMRASFTSSGQTRELVFLSKGKLIRWVLNHIKKMDKSFAQYLRAHHSPRKVTPR